MKKILLLSGCLIIVFTNLKAQEEIVSGTRVSLVPPAGFAKGQNFAGYQKGEEAMINVMDLNGGNFYSNAARFTKENFEAKGVKVLSFKELKINGYPAKYVELQSDQDAISVNMVFGDSTFSAMLIGVYPSSNETLGNQIKQSILSANYDPSYVVSPFENAFFTLDDSKTKLKFSQANAGMFIYTVGGESQNTGDSPILLVLPLPNDPTSSPKQTAESMIAGLQGKGLTDVKYLKSTNTTINGYSGYELLAQGAMNGTSTSIFVQTIVSGDNQLIIQGLQNGKAIDPDVIRELTSTVKME